MAYQPIENYGIIGDLHTTALVGTSRDELALAVEGRVVIHLALNP